MPIAHAPPLFACHSPFVTRTSPRPMKRFFLFAIMLLSIACGLRAQTAPDAAELTKLLQDFLAGAGRNDVAMHERFWAADLIYTSALGRRKGKADILRELRAETLKPVDGTTVYTAEDI